MKHINSDGLKLQVRNIGEVIYSLQASEIPLPIIPNKIFSADEARKLLTEIKNSKQYKRII